MVVLLWALRGCHRLLWKTPRAERRLLYPAIPQAESKPTANAPQPRVGTTRCQRTKRNSVLVWGLRIALFGVCLQAESNIVFETLQNAWKYYMFFFILFFTLSQHECRGACTGSQKKYLRWIQDSLLLLCGWRYYTSLLNSTDVYWGRHWGLCMTPTTWAAKNCGLLAYKAQAPFPRRSRNNHTVSASPDISRYIPIERVLMAEFYFVTKFCVPERVIVE